jgi:hypothetical protein
VDAIIIVSSFTIDLVFLGGVSGEEGQKAVAVLVVLLLWRIARVVDGKKLFIFSISIRFDLIRLSATLEKLDFFQCCYQISALHS